MIRNGSYIVLCSLLLLACSGGSKSQLIPSDYVNYLDNSYRKQIKVGGCLYEFQLKTPEYVLSKEILRDKTSNDDYSSRLDELNSTIWFNVYLSATGGGENLLKKGVSGLEEYNYRLDYFLRIAEKNISLKYGGVELERVAYVFENNHGLSPKDVMVVGFKLPKENFKNDLKLTYVDELFNNGPLHVIYSKKALQELPKLRI